MFPNLKVFFLVSPVSKQFLPPKSVCIHYAPILHRCLHFRFYQRFATFTDKEYFLGVGIYTQCFEVPLSRTFLFFKRILRQSYSDLGSKQAKTCQFGSRSTLCKRIRLRKTFCSKLQQSSFIVKESEFLFVVTPFP